MKKTLLFLVCSCLTFLLPAISKSGITLRFDHSKINANSFLNSIFVSMIHNHKRALSPYSAASVARIESDKELGATSKRRASFSKENDSLHNHVLGLAIRRPISVEDSVYTLQDCEVNNEGPTPVTPTKNAEDDCVVKTPSPAPTPTNDTCLRLRSYSSESNAGGYFLKSVSIDQFDVSPVAPYQRKHSNVIPMTKKSYSYGSNDELRRIGIRKSHRSIELLDNPTPTLVPSPSPRKE